jgi:hypothetical protein
VLSACAICVSIPLGSRAQTEPPANQDAAPAPDSADGLRTIKGLPSWIRLGAELVGRADFEIDGDQDRDDRVYLNRVRIRATLQPLGWLKFALEGQDARAFHFGDGPDIEGRSDTIDLRQAYVQIGHAEQGFQMRFGRQEIAVGDERLVGADNYWDPFGQAFDALRLGFNRGKYHVDVFTGFRVDPNGQRPDPFDRANRISGLAVQLDLPRGQSLQPYLMWKRGENTLSLMEHPGHRDVVTPGFLAKGDLPKAMDYDVEMALQRGHVVSDDIAAWAGHWELGWKPLGREFGFRLGAEYNYASGDADAADGKHGTFDDLYPAGFNKYGIIDPYAWRNIRYPAFGADIPLSRRWTAYGGFRAYWLATVHDGVYPGGDEYEMRNPDATSSHIGNQVYASIAYSHSERWRVYAGYGHLFPGSYLRQSSCDSVLRTVYLLTSFTF